MKRKKKETKSLELFKKGFRKNEVVIYAIALMLVTAGYFNYTANLENNSIETYSESLQNTAKIDEKKKETKKESNEQKNELKKDDVLTKNENKEQIDKNQLKNNDDNTNNNENEIDNVKTTVAKNEEKKEGKDDEDIGDAKLVNSNDVVSEYFVSAKLQRDTNYADMLSTYTKIIEDNSVSETQKAIAMKEITKITDTKNAISICENMLSTKGFENYVVFVNNDSVNVVVQVKEKLSREKVAQIQNIVSRELNSKIENIHITEK